MKITKIEKLCKAKKDIIRLEAVSDEGNWRGTFVGTGDGVLALDEDFPDLSAEIFLEVFGVAEKDRKKWSTRSVTSASRIYAFEFPGELPCYERPVVIGTGAGDWSAFRVCNGKNFFVPEEYIEPFRKEQNVLFYLREIEERKYLAIKTGWLLEGVVAIPPEDSAEIMDLARILRSIVLGEGN